MQAAVSVTTLETICYDLGNAFVFPMLCSYDDNLKFILIITLVSKAIDQFLTFTWDGIEVMSARDTWRCTYKHLLWFVRLNVSPSSFWNNKPEEYIGIGEWVLRGIINRFFFLQWTVIVRVIFLLAQCCRCWRPSIVVSPLLLLNSISFTACVVILWSVVSNV